jgi:hypothetical protein
MITPARTRRGIHSGRPGRGVARVVGKRREGLTQAFVAGPAEGDAPVFAGRRGHGGHAGLGGGELLGGGKAGAVIPELGEDLGGVDRPPAGEALDERAIGVLGERGRDRRGELLQLDAERREDGAWTSSPLASVSASPVWLTGASRRRVSSSAAERRPQ